MNHDELLHKYQKDQVDRALKMVEAMFGKMSAESRPRMLADILEGISEIDVKPAHRLKRRL